MVVEDDVRFRGNLSTPVTLHTSTNVVTLFFQKGASGVAMLPKLCDQNMRKDGWSTAAYIVTRAGMHTYLKMARDMGLTKPVDHMMWSCGGVMATDPAKLRVTHGKIYFPGMPLTPDINSERALINQAM